MNIICTFKDSLEKRKWRRLEKDGRDGIFHLKQKDASNELVSKGCITLQVFSDMHVNWQCLSHFKQILILTFSYIVLLWGHAYEIKEHK